METKPLEALTEDPNNPREIAAAALDGLGESVREFGDLSGIVFNQRTGQLVAGHQRLKTLRAAGAKEWLQEDATTGYVLHPQTGDAFPIRIVDWDHERQRLANLVANNPAIQGEFTAAALAQLRGIEDEAMKEALRLVELEKDLADEFGDEDDARGGGGEDPGGQEPPAAPVTKLGDLWILGEHRLLCGDATNVEHVRRLMNGERAMLLATDPPYGVDYTAVKKGMPVSGLGDAQDRWGDIANDDLKGDDLGSFLDQMFTAAKAAVGDTPAIYVWHPSGELNHVFRSSMLKAGMLVHRQIIWAKPGFVLTRSGMYHWAHETCFYGWYQGHQPPWYGEKNQTSVWSEGRDDGKSVHPTQKPVALFEVPMQNHTRAGEVCYEPFSGSGSQLIAGERLRRRVFAMELSPRWVDAAVSRWEAMTGQKAERA